MSRVAAVHFTHHLCGACMTGESYDDYAHSYRNDRLPFDSCPAAKRVGDKALASSDLDKVTCGRCRQCFQRQRDRRIFTCSGDLISDAAISVRLWKICCRHKGVPRPKAMNADELAMQMHDALSVRPWIMAELGDDRMSERLSLNAIEVSLANVDPEVIDAVRPALNELTMAMDLLAEARAMVHRAESTRDVVVARIRSGELGAVA